MSLKCNFTPRETEELKIKTTAYRELKERQNELAEEAKSLKQDVARLLEGKVKDASLYLKAMCQQWEKGENDVDEIAAVMEAVRNAGNGE